MRKLPTVRDTSICDVMLIMLIIDMLILQMVRYGMARHSIDMAAEFSDSTSGAVVRE